jgi:hypothetical protein
VPFPLPSATQEGYGGVLTCLHTGTHINTGHLFESLQQVIQPVCLIGYTTCINLTMHVQTQGITDKPKNEQVTHKIHPNYRMLNGRMTDE